MTKKSACSVCLKNCRTDCILCESCTTWFHYECQNIDVGLRKQWSQVSAAYICITCRSKDDGSFDFLMGSGRLQQAANHGYKKLKTAVEREKLFLVDVPVANELHQDFESNEHDLVSNFILDHYHSNDKTAVVSTGDGNCLFNSVSICLCGDESRSIELRYRCSIEMVINRHKIVHHRLYDKMQLLSDDLDKDTVNCAQQNSYSSSFRILALSNLLNIPIECVYPAINGTRYFAFKAYNTTFRPPFADPENGNITIMWTSTVVPKRNEIVSGRIKSGTEWRPNHFVPLVVTAVRRNSVKVNDILESPSIGKVPHTEPALTSSNRYQCLDVALESLPDLEEPINPTKTTKKSKTVHETTTTTKACSKDRKQRTIQTTTSPAKPVSQTTDSIISGDVDGVGDISTLSEMSSDIQDIRQLSTILEESLRSPDCNYVDYDSDNSSFATGNSVMEPDSLVDTGSIISEETFVPGPLKKFMDMPELLNLFKGPYTVINDIPTARKDGMFFIINNENNMQNRTNGSKSEFWDNCGAWNKAACPIQNFVEMNNKLISVVLKDGLYCSEKMCKGKRVYVPIEEKADGIDIFKVHRIYQTLKASTSGKEQFKRRITWFAKVPPSMSFLPMNVAVVEYIGVFPSRSYHGNVKYSDNNQKYIKTKSHVKKNLKEMLKSDTVSDVERKINTTQTDEHEKMRNNRQLKNFKYALDKAAKDFCGSTGNAADHVIAVEEMVHTHPLVYSVKHSKDIKNPLVTLFTSQQINDVKRFCCRPGGSVLGMDKTYNLGDFHVTPTVYKDLSVLRRMTGDHPLCFGPIFIHCSSTTKAISTFLHEIADNLTEEEISNLTIGTDEELSFKNAIHRCLPGCTHVLCTRHLKQNTSKYLEDNVGYPLNDRQYIIKAIFEEDGIIYSEDTDTYDTRVRRILEFIETKDCNCEKKFKGYFENKLIPLLQQHVMEPAKQGKIPVKWTNNNSESVNHILKAAIKWKAQDMPKFIKTVHTIIEGDFTERCRAIRNRGNFRLHPNFHHHLVDLDVWTDMSQSQREAREKRFFSDKGREKPNVITSTAGNRTVMKTPSAGKKPHQRKRKRSERSRTPKSKRQLIAN